MKLLVLLVLGAMSLWGCGDSSERPKPVPMGNAGASSVPRGGSNGVGEGGEGGDSTPVGGSSGTGAQPSGGGEGGQGEPDPGGLAPAVTVASPAAVAAPADGGVLTDPSFTVVCRVEPSTEPGAGAINSVEVSVLGSDGAPLDEVTAVPTKNANEYSAQVVLGVEAMNGTITVRCEATDSATPANYGSDEIETFFDGGPSVTIGRPKENEARSVRDIIDFEFTAVPAPVAPDDPDADVVAVHLEVEGQTFEVTDNGNGRYTAEVNLGDTDLFPVTPSDTVPVALVAENARGVERRVFYRFKIDGKGPEITIVSPVERQVVGGAETIEFRLEDPDSGVNVDRIVVLIQGREYRWDDSGAWAQKPDGTYTFAFDVGQLGQGIPQITVNVHATDNAGNLSRGESVVCYVDNVPPGIHLHHEPIRERWRGQGTTTGFYCSQPFYPLGEGAVRDGSTIRDFGMFRALVFDETNAGVDQKFLFKAGVDPTSVLLYLQPDTDAPFLIDARGGDGLCDDIADIESLPYFVRLEPIPEMGSPPNGPLTYDTQAPTIPRELCDADLGTPVDFLCNRWSDMTRVIDLVSLGNEPVIYGLAPSNMPQGAPTCTGVTWGVRDLLKTEGWVCAAAVAEDQQGNRDVSPPLRFCLDDGVAPHPNCNGAPPPCTSQCSTATPTLPPVLLDDD